MKKLHDVLQAWRIKVEGDYVLFYMKIECAIYDIKVIKLKRNLPDKVSEFTNVRPKASTFFNILGFSVSKSLMFFFFVNDSLQKKKAQQFSPVSRQWMVAVEIDEIKTAECPPKTLTRLRVLTHLMLQSRSLHNLI